MTVSEQVTYERIYWVMGPVPKDMRTRFPQDVQDPPTSGWGHALVYRPKRSDAKYARVFDPSTGWHREVNLESMELATSKPVLDFDSDKCAKRIARTFAERDALGVGMSFSGANFFLGLLGHEPCIRTGQDDDEAKPEKVKEEKAPVVNPRAGLIQAGDIAAELKIEPRQLREACRKLGIPKPELGWAGDAAWAADIKTRVTAFLATPKAPKEVPVVLVEEAVKTKRVSGKKPNPQQKTKGKK